MRNGTRFLLVILFMFASSMLAFGQASVTIQNDDLELEVGDTVELEAIYTDDEGTEIDTTFMWRVHPRFLGDIDSADVFTANAAGNGILVASVGVLSDSIFVTIEAAGDYPAIVVLPDEIELRVGETSDVVALYYDESGELMDTTFTWTLDPDSIGILGEDLVFEALLAGEGTLTATLGELSVEIPVEIEEDNGSDDPCETNLFVVPGDTIVNVGSELTFTLWRHTEEGGAVEMAATWSLDGDPIGTITEAGVLSVEQAGYSLVHATSDSGDATALIIADNLDGGDPNTITITRESPSPRGYNVMATITEGQSWTIGGLPHPLNILNGGEIYFPNGSLTEDIRLHVALPGFAHDYEDSVGFGQNIITGVEFQVMVEDEHIQPYWFESPLFVSLVFKRGLINQMGINPEDLALYFATVDGDTIALDTTAVTNTMVDSVRNRIFSNVAHFSSLVVAPGIASLDVQEYAVTHPNGFELAAPWPNPFNASTSLQVVLPQAGRLELTLFDILGREVHSLAQKDYAAGRHTFSLNGAQLSSGVYFVRASYDNVTLARKVVLLK